jgi:hypothetical protein
VGLVGFSTHHLLLTTHYSLLTICHSPEGVQMGKPHEQLDAWKFAMQLVKLYINSLLISQQKSAMV